MARISAADAGGPNVLAFLDMLAWSEGTSIIAVSDDGYDVLIGGKLFADCSRHPRVSVPLPRYGISSTAAGRYQFLARIYAIVKKYGFKGRFMPEGPGPGGDQAADRVRRAAPDQGRAHPGGDRQGGADLGQLAGGRVRPARACVIEDDQVRAFFGDSQGALVLLGWLGQNGAACRARDVPARWLSLPNSRQHSLQARAAR